jgi:peptidylprolyl isomerase
VTTDSHVTYLDIVRGTGETPQTGQTVVIHYTAWLSNGTKIDSSRDRGTPKEFVLGAGQEIAGLEEGVATMRVGGRRFLTIPPELAWGEQGYPPTIPPNATLIFDVELLEVR